MSVGQRHRVALAQVFMKEPEVAILDEPTGTIDAITKKSIADSIVSAHNNLHSTIIIITHDNNFAMNVCDRIAYMDEGKIKRIEELKR